MTALALTASGNEITDALRALGIQGDGRAVPDSSFGLYEPTTNHVLNGGAETNLVGISAQARVVGDAKFGIGCAESVNAGGGQGIFFDTAVGKAWAAGQWLVGSVWVKAKDASFVGLTINVRVRCTNTDATITDVGLINVPLTAGYTRYTVVGQVAVGKTADKASVLVINSLAQTAGFRADGAMIEATSGRPTATPYVHTDGAAASRLASRVQAPSSLLSPIRGSAFFRVRPSYPSAQGIAVTNGQGSSLRLLNWADVATNRILLVHSQGTAGSFTAFRQTAGAGVAVAAAAVWNLGDVLSVAAAWDETKLYVSVNGAPFVSTVNAPPGAIASAVVDFGSLAGAGGFMDGDMLMAVLFSGVLTNADVAALHALGSDPSWPQLPLSADPTLLWTADTLNATSKGPVTVGFDTPQPNGLRLDVPKPGGTQFDTPTPVGVR